MIATASVAEAECLARQPALPEEAQAARSGVVSADVHRASHGSFAHQKPRLEGWRAHGLVPAQVLRLVCGKEPQKEQGHHLCAGTLWRSSLVKLRTACKQRKRAVSRSLSVRKRSRSAQLRAIPPPASFSRCVRRSTHTLYQSRWPHSYTRQAALRSQHALTFSVQSPLAGDCRPHC